LDPIGVVKIGLYNPKRIQTHKIAKETVII